MATIHVTSVFCLHFITLGTTSATRTSKKPSSLFKLPNWDFKIQRRWRRRERQKNNRLYKKNNNTQQSRFFVHFFARFCTTTTWKCLISRFMEYVNKQQRNFTSLSTWTWSLGIQLQEGSPTFDKVGGSEKTERTQIHFLSDVFVAVASRRWILKSLISINREHHVFSVVAFHMAYQFCLFQAFRFWL